ncbi:MAG: DNA-processing protein DprA [Acidimicrobiales bacterium]
MTAVSRSRACAAALAGLEGMTPRRLVALLERWGPEEAWSLVASGAHPRDSECRFRAAARRVEVGAVGDRYRCAGVDILVRDDPAYPAALRGDPGAPAVLFVTGDPAVLADRSAVAVVGTRSATPYGRQVAAELGRDLASAGVVVVSGLALGIDGAAHAGALDAGPLAAPPVGVVATGLDVAYPAVHRQLWHAVAARGAVVSEAPLGAPPRRGRFPARNRIVAGLSDVVVVVECHRRGGSIYTAEAAARRSIPVGAVPGSVRSPASAGTNALLVDGCFPVRDAEDVLVAVSLAQRRADRPEPLPATGVPVAARARAPRGDQRRPKGAASASAPPPAPADGTVEAMVLSALDTVPTPIETVAVRTGLPIGGLAQALHHLVVAGWVDAGDGWWSIRYPLPGQQGPKRRGSGG